jgi:hypothetical protein
MQWSAKWKPGPVQPQVTAIWTKLNSQETEMQADLRRDNCTKLNKMHGQAAKMKMQTANLMNNPVPASVPASLKLDSPPLYRWLSPGALVSMTIVVLNQY